MVRGESDSADTFLLRFPPLTHLKIYGNPEIHDIIEHGDLELTGNYLETYRRRHKQREKLEHL